MQSALPTPTLQVPPPISKPARRPGHPLSRLPTYLLAIVLPILASIANAHFAALKSVPFSLYFISAVIIASLGGIVPSGLALAVSIFSRNYFVDPSHGVFHLSGTDAIRLVILGTGAAFVSLIAGRRRRAAEQLEDALALLQDRSNALIESLRASKCASWSIDLSSGRFTRWYEGSFQIFGRPFAELEALPSLEPLLYKPDQPRLRSLRDHMLNSHDPIVFEHRVPWPNGELHTLEMRATRLPGPAPIWRGVTVDITDRKLSDAALLRSEKLAAMGRLASTVAHEVNNPLEAVTNLLYLIRADSTLSQSSREYLALAESELARLTEITRLTLGFVRSNSSPCNILVSESVDTTLAIFAQRFRARGIFIERHYQPGIAVAIAPHELRQIVTNLVSNAADAVPVRPPAAIPGPNSPRIAVHVFAEDQNAVLLVEDNGSGISGEDIARIFEPFFTTKLEVGTGIGLWVTRELVESNGGTISVDSGNLPDGMRTRFRIELPLASSDEPTGSPARASTS